MINKMELYKIVDYEDLKEGEPIIAFAKHVLRWNFEMDGIPQYGIVPVEEQEQETEENK